MLLIFKIILILCLAGISYQDFYDRKVFLWLLILGFVFMGFLHLNSSGLNQFLISTSVNTGIILLIFLIITLYSNVKLKTSLQNSFGVGDLLFFLAIAAGFPIATFVVIFTFSLFFSLITFLFFKSKLKLKTVPLAGLQAVFIGLIYLSNWSFCLINLYQY